MSASQSVSKSVYQSVNRPVSHSASQSVTISLSIDKGEISKEFAQEIIESLFIKMGTQSKLRDRMTATANTGRGYGGESLTIGGVDRDGNDISNDVTFMVLDGIARLRMIVPWFV